MGLYQELKRAAMEQVIESGVELAGIHIPWVVRAALGIRSFVKAGQVLRDAFALKECYGVHVWYSVRYSSFFFPGVGYEWNWTARMNFLFFRWGGGGNTTVLGITC